MACVAFRGPAERALAVGVLSLLTWQFALGVADVALLAPLWLQITHLLGAYLLSISFCWPPGFLLWQVNRLLRNSMIVAKVDLRG
jgi:cytochrome c oxidase assembly protein subunit 15